MYRIETMSASKSGRACNNLDFFICRFFYLFLRISPLSLSFQNMNISDVLLSSECLFLLSCCAFFVSPPVSLAFPSDWQNCLCHVFTLLFSSVHLSFDLLLTAAVAFVIFSLSVCSSFTASAFSPCFSCCCSWYLFLASASFFLVCLSLCVHCCF